MKKISDEKVVISGKLEKERAKNLELNKLNEELSKDTQEKNLKMEELVKKLDSNQKQNELNEQLRKETARKTRQIEELSNKLEDSNQTSDNLKIKLQISCENVNDLTEDIRVKKKELNDQDKKISLLIAQAGEHDQQMKELTRSIEQAKDENVRIKNQAKVARQENLDSYQNADVVHLYRKFEELKKDVSKQLLSFTTQSEEISTSQSRKKERRKKKRKRKKKLETDSEDPSEVSADSEEESDEEVGETENADITLRPGSRQYSEVVKNKKKKRKTLILSTSITRDIDEERFNECYSDGDAEFVRLRGWKVNKIKDEVKKNVQHGCFDSAIVHIGGNDLQDLYYPESFPKLANDVKEIGLMCRERGADTVFIAGVTVRKWEYTWERCRLLNGRLKELCRVNNFVYIDNSNINYVDHLSDSVHLNSEGSKLLANNYLGYMYKVFKSQR